MKATYDRSSMEHDVLTILNDDGSLSWSGLVPRGTGENLAAVFGLLDRRAPHEMAEIGHIFCKQAVVKAMKDGFDMAVNSVNANLMNQDLDPIPLSWFGVDLDEEEEDDSVTDDESYYDDEAERLRNEMEGF